jgi:hypothetical protein
VIATRLGNGHGMEQIIWTRTGEVLDDLDVSATKGEIVDHADCRGGPDDVVRPVRGLPLATYENIGELRSSLRLDPAADDVLHPSDTAARARSAHSHRIAEHLRAPH